MSAEILGLQLFGIRRLTNGVPEAPAPSADRALVPGTETILLVEDELEVRDLAREVVEQLSSTVLVASMPSDAIPIAQGHVGMVDLLLTDVIMPRMSGRALAEAVTAERPETKVLFRSGYTGQAIARHGVLEPGTDFLEKPFSPQTLATKVREVLDRPFVPRTRAPWFLDAWTMTPVLRPSL